MTTVSKKGFWLAGASAIAVMVSIASAQAGGFSIREQSAEGQGDSFAGAAAGGAGLGSMYWNPATITDFAGLNSSSNFTGILPSANVNVNGGALFPAPFVPRATGEIGQGAVVPASYYSYQFSDQWWLGLSLNSPLGLVTRLPIVWDGTGYGGTSKVSSFNANPVIAYKINEMVSVAIGVQAMWFKATLNPGVTPPAPLFGSPGVFNANLSGDSWGVGVTAGITFKPMAGTEIGLGYRSSVRENLSGNFVTPVPIAGITAVPLATTARLGVDTPDIVTLGLKQRINDQITLLAGIEYNHWRLGVIPVALGNGAILPVTFNFKDGWFYSLGGEYKWNEALTLRAGVAYEKSPVTDADRRPFLPDTDRFWTSLGLSYKWNQKLSIDVGYSHIFAKNGTINQLFNPNLLQNISATTKAHVDIVSVGMQYRWDDPKIAQPIFAKY